MFARCLFVVFFLKQKTAYEMRISDWSSDVCSSDLGQGRLENSALSPNARRLFGPAQRGQDGADDPRRGQAGLGVLHLGLVVVDEGVELGGASCRGRVGKYV